MAHSTHFLLIILMSETLKKQQLTSGSLKGIDLRLAAYQVGAYATGLQLNSDTYRCSMIVV